jgi:F-type H+-transporting ATPase subunit c
MIHHLFFGRFGMEYLTCCILAAGEATGRSAGTNWTVLGAVLASAVIVIGVSLSIAKIGGRAVDSIARQPESGSRIFMAMILAAALVEGVTFFALLICFLTVFWMR